MTVIGYDSFIQIEYIPARIEVQEHRKEKAVCRKCSKNGKESIFAVAKAPAPLIERSYATPSLVAHIINEKYVKAVPLYRIEKEFLYSGISMSRQTMDNLIIAAAEMLTPLYELMHKTIVKLVILHADETPLQTNRVKGRKGPVRGYMWVYRSGRYSEIPIVLYEYQNGRKGEYPKLFLKGFSGYLNCDGLRQYDDVENIIRVGCWAHLRRYFLNALNIQQDKFLHLLSGQTADKNNILLKLRPTGLLKIRSVNFSCKANFICLCQITLYSFSSFSISVPLIFFRTALNAIFSRSVGFISVIFLPSRS